MKLNYFISLIIAAILITGCIEKAGTTKNISNVDGVLKNGLRHINVSKNKKIKIKVFRGDYIVPVLEKENSYSVILPQLKINKKYPVKNGRKKYIKMKKAGSFKIKVGGQSGTINVIEYTQPHYKAVLSQEADQIIKNISPLILDVRTPREYNSVRIKNAKLMPIQILQQKISQLEPYKDREIFIYCATGNRSTVASKILIDRGFKKIYNLRYGIVGWIRNGYPVIR
ncbi:rhodanese-like domain-containing protein [Spirochaetota bacterium]